MIDALRAIARCIPYQGQVYRYAHILAKAHAVAIGHPDPWKYAYAHDSRHLAEAAEIFLTLTDPRSFGSRQMRYDVMNFKYERAYFQRIEK